MRFAQSSIGVALSVSLALGIGMPLVGQKGAIAAPTNQEQSEIDRTMVTSPSSEPLPQHLEKLYQQGKYDQAKIILESVLDHCRKTENLGCQAEALNDLGRILGTKGEHTQALSYYQEALPIVQKLKSPLLSLLLQNMGLTYFKLDDYQQSLKSYQNALQNADNILDETFCRLGIARQYEALGNYKEAFIQYQKVMEIAQGSNDKKLKSVALANIASFHVSLKQYDQAIEAYRKSLRIIDFSDSPVGYGNILNNLGLAYAERGIYSQALTLLQEALKISNDYKDFDNIPFRQMNIADVYVGKRDFNSAIRTLESALNFSKRIGRREVSMFIYEKLGNLYRKTKKYDMSLYYFQQQLNQSSTPNDNTLALNQIAYIYELKNLPNLAISFYKKSINIRETLRENLKFLPRNEQSLYTQKIASTYRDLANLLTKQGRLAEAQEVIELLKIGELKKLSLDRQQTQAPIQQIPISDTEKQSIAQINPEIAKDITPEALPTRDRLSSHPLNQSAQALLNAQPNSALVYHLLTDDKLLILLITPDGKIQKFASAANKTTIESIVTQFRKQIEQCEPIGANCDKNDTQTFNSISQKLYQQLFPQDLQATLKAANTKHLTFALDGTLRNIPIAALHTGQQYLIEQYSLSQIIAAQLTNSQDKLPPTANQTSILAVGTAQSAGIAIPDYVDASGFDLFPALGNVPLELAAIISNEPNTNTFSGEQLLDQAFTLPNLQQKLPRHRILHIASHGIFRPNFLDYSYILLGNGTDRKWSIPQMDNTNRNLFQNIHLVTLSACQTGLGDRDNTGMEIAGMSHAFLSQGAKAVQATLWQVNDASTAMLMQRFYQNLAQNPQATKAQALQQAQLYLLRTPQAQLNKNFMDSLSRFENLDKMNQSSKSPSRPKILDKNHPYYWAAFILIGNNR